MGTHIILTSSINERSFKLRLLTKHAKRTAKEKETKSVIATKNCLVFLGEFNNLFLKFLVKRKFFVKRYLGKVYKN